jgi:hypothetical protein
MNGIFLLANRAEERGHLMVPFWLAARSGRWSGSDKAVYVTQVRHDRVGFMLMPINECYPYMQKKHDTMTQDSV